MGSSTSDSLRSLRLESTEILSKLRPGDGLQLTDELYSRFCCAECALVVFKRCKTRKNCGGVASKEKNKKLMRAG